MRRRRLGPALRAGLWVAVLACAALGTQGRALGQRYDSRDVVAAFVGQVVTLVKWPEGQGKASAKPWVIAVLGDSPVTPRLEILYRKRKVLGRAVSVRRIKSVSELGDAQVLFVARSEASRLPAILERLRGRAVLTMSHARAFSGEGVAVNFVLHEARVRFEIDRDALKRAGLSASYRLLHLAVPGPRGHKR